MGLLKMEKHIHEFAQGLSDFSTIIFHLHVFALVVINLTKTPHTSATVNRIYRGLEMLAGLLTPLAKR
jgi:hypothetical protein